MISRAAAILLLPFVFGAEYNYDRCDKAAGPSAWASPCNPNQQSGTPINLCGGVPFPGTSRPTISVTGYTTSRALNVLNNGHTLQVNVPATATDAPTLTAGALAATVGRGTNSTTQTWQLAQMHLHWGRVLLTEGSEHYMQGTRYVLEAHFVHFNRAYGTSLTQALQQTAIAPDTLLVVGVFLQLGSTDSAVIKAIGDVATTAPLAPKALASNVALNDLFDGTGNFYSYGGGLTTPACNEIVTWIVMKDIKSVTSATLNNIWQARTNPPATANSKFAAQADELISKYGNFRPLQPLGGRTVYSSDGATAACAAVTEPEFVCTPAKSAGSLAAPSLSLALLLVALTCASH